jgi:drug/metabolite transporter (DMT)-like permease
MIWLILLAIAYFFYAAVFILDKYILSRPMPDAMVYTFWVSFLGICILVLIPIFGFSLPIKTEVFWSLMAGFAQVGGLILFYHALNKSELTRLVPFVGAISAVFILIINSITIHEFLGGRQIIAFTLLVLGSLVIGLQKREFFGNGVLAPAIISSFLFAVFWVITKYLFLGTDFVSGLIWVRAGVAIVALLLLLFRKSRQAIFSKTREMRPKTTGFFMLGRLLNIAGSLFFYGAVFLGSVTLANALQGLQYVFVLILALLLFKRIPGLKEQFGKEFLMQKIFAVALICVGLFILVI